MSSHLLNPEDNGFSFAIYLQTSPPPPKKTTPQKLYLLCFFFTLREGESKVSLMEFVFCFWFPSLVGSGAAGNLKSKFENLAKEQEEVRYF